VQERRQVAKSADSPSLRATRFVTTHLESDLAMPVVWALTAGSLGDIQGVIALVCKLGKAIYDSSDASSDYQELKEEIVTFMEILIQAKNVIEEVQEVQASRALQNSVHSLLSEMKKCRTDLKDFLHKYPIQNRWNKIMWARWGNSAAASLREKLSMRRQTIQIKLTTFVALKFHHTYHTETGNSGQFFSLVNVRGMIAIR
jgi:hypothetical protein